MITYNPDGGDLGRASIKPITALEMQIIIPHVANILGELESRRVQGELPFKYAFELHSTERALAELVMKSTSHSLPFNVFWYEIDGLNLFQMRSASGGIVSSYICYLVTK